VSNEKVIARIQEEIDGLNEKFGNWEKIKRFELTPDIWSIEGGQLTPTLKLKENSYGKIYQFYSIKSTINVILSIRIITNKYGNHETKNPVLFSIKYFVIF
jgi:hypothetical protein